MHNGQRSRLAIIEDHPLVRDAFAQLVGTIPGAEVVFSGASLSEAVTAIRTGGADLVVLDLDLGDGQPPIQNVAQLVGLDVPILVVSSLADAPTVRAALIAGASGYVSKNSDADEILEAIRASLAGEEYVSHELSTHILGHQEVGVGLSEQERRAMVLYASGLKMASVARRMGVSLGTAQEYVKRVRVKYLKAGTPIPTKTDMYRVARAEGIIP